MSQASRILLALVAGLAVGMIGAWAAWRGLDAVVAVAGTVGGLWLDGLRMTIIPLVFALIVTGIAAAARTAHAGGVARRALIVFVALLALSALLSALIVPLLFAMLPAPGAALDAARAALNAGPTPVVPPFSDALRGIIPVNVVAAAVEGAIMPLVVFALLFGVAAARLPAERGAPLLDFFAAIADAMLVVVHWVLKLAVIGVFALALVVGATVGLGAGTALVNYVGVHIVLALILAALIYPLAVIKGGVKLGAFAKAVAPAQAVAASTQSSLASLPVMLDAAEEIGVPQRISSVVLPLAVALFKITVPSHCLLVAIALAWLNGIEIQPLQLALAAGVAVLSTFVVVGLPGQISFFASMTPPALALGAPIDLLPLLLAVDTIPDIFRTIANVTADVGATAIVAHGEEDEWTDEPTLSPAEQGR